MADVKVEMTAKDLADLKKYRDLKLKEKRYWVKQQLMLEKAAAKGITVTDAEIDARIKSKQK